MAGSTFITKGELMMKRLLTAMLCVVMALCMFGCGQSNEEKYTTLKNEVNEEIKKAVSIQPGYMIGGSEFSQIPMLEKYVADVKPIKEKILSKLGEMKKLSQKELKLTNDFAKFEEETQQKIYKEITRAEKQKDYLIDLKARDAGKINESRPKTRSEIINEVFNGN